MRILAYEFFASGARKSITDTDSDLIRLGFAMLDSLLKDLSIVPGIEVYTILHPSLKGKVFRSSYSKRVHFIWSEDITGYYYLNHIRDNLDLFDGAILIAPETDGLLESLVEFLERKGKKVFGSSSQAIAQVSHKAKALTLLKSHGLLVPKTDVFTLPLSLYWQDEIVGRFGLPTVFKPVDGAGGQGVIVIRDKVQMKNYVDYLQSLNKTSFLVQEYIPGESASVSCLVTDDRVLPLSMNIQILHGGDELLFEGITITKGHPQEQEAFLVAQRACEAIKGLKGFVGVDLVLTPAGPIIMEINPRITMAYPALRKVVARNLAYDHLQTCMENHLPRWVDIHETVTYLVDQEQNQSLAEPLV